MTNHVLDQLPLWVEGDLTNPEMAMVERHLAHCPTCREAADEMRASQAWLRGALAAPFSASDEDAWHRAVMAQIRAEAAAKPIRRLAVRRGLLAASAASLLIATFIWHRGRPAVTPAPGIPAPVAALRSWTEPTQEASPRQATHHLTRIPPPPTDPGTVAAPAVPPPGGPTRIEFQTADPNTRIIWLARATPLPDTNPTLQEAP